MTDAPRVRRTGRLSSVAGTFFRAVDRDHVAAALDGSRVHGRYSRSDQPTLYLSASPAGVRAAMVAHQRSTDNPREVVAFRVDGEAIFDLRDRASIAEARAQAGDPFANWQEAIARGESPASWRVRDWIEAQGANGLLDPSRQSSGLWHLVLFRWNVAGAPFVRA